MLWLISVLAGFPWAVAAGAGMGSLPEHKFMKMPTPTEIQRLFGAFGLQGPEPGQLIPTPVGGDIVSPEDALTQFHAFRKKRPGSTGWVCTADRLHLVGGNDTLSDTSPLLSAELCEGNLSLHIRQSEDGYTATEIRRDEDGEGTTFITRQSLLCADTRLGAHATYEVCWRLMPNASPATDEPAGTPLSQFQPVLSRFVGFTNERE